MTLRERAAKAFRCTDWSEAFDVARERDRPVLVLVGDELGRCFPSGYYQLLGYWPARAEGGARGSIEPGHGRGNPERGK